MTLRDKYLSEILKIKFRLQDLSKVVNSYIKVMENEDMVISSIGRFAVYGFDDALEALVDAKKAAKDLDYKIRLEDISEEEE